MKKKKEKKKADMPEFEFRTFTPEEDKIYEEAIGKYRESIVAGKPLRDAYASFPIADKELEALIQADFLKILIAEQHFAKNQPLDTIAAALAIPLQLVQDTKARMLQEVVVSAANQFADQIAPAVKATND